MSKVVTTYTLERGTSGPYAYDSLWLRSAYKDPIKKWLSENPESNRKGVYERLLVRGHKYVYSMLTVRPVHIRIDWQVFKEENGQTDYCEPNFQSVGESYQGILNGMRLLKRIAKKVREIHHPEVCAPIGNFEFKDPHKVLSALDNLRGLAKVSFDKDTDCWV